MENKNKNVENIVDEKKRNTSSDKPKVEKLNTDSINVCENKFTTTKKVLWLSWGSFILLVILTCFGINVGIAMEVVGGVVTSVTTGFYLWKSKCENKQKIAVSLVDSLADKYGIENVISLLGNILQE